MDRLILISIISSTIVNFLSVIIEKEFGPATQHNNKHERDLFQRGGIEFVNFLIALGNVNR
jgi:hypothetical protein